MNVRLVAFKLLVDWERKKKQADALLEQTLLYRYKNISQHERAFLTELFYGVLRWLNQLDYIIDQFSHVKPKKISIEVRSLLRLGIYQLYYLDGIPPWVAVYETVEIAKKELPPWVIGFINAILRRVVREKDKIKFPDDKVSFISLKYAHPEWMVKYWLKHFGEENTISICKFNNITSPIVIRTNTLKITREELKKKFLSINLKANETRFTPEGLILGKLPCSLSELPGFKEGLFFPQSEVSQIITHLLSPKSDEIILDGCAGVGGKTTHIAQLMQNKGKIYAIETNKERVQRLYQNLKKFEIKNTIVKPGFLEKNITSFPKNYFDRILIDAPCSGLGVLRKNVDLKWRKKEEDIKKLSQLQLLLLKSIPSYLKKNGILLYVTCTLTKEENEDVIKAFLKMFPNFCLEDIAFLFPQYAQFCKNCFFQTLPHIHNLEGFFAARLRKVDD